MFSLLTGLADLVGSVWTLFNSVTNGIMGFAGFEEPNEDDERPAWVTYLICGLLVLLLILFLWLAIHQG